MKWAVELLAQVLIRLQFTVNKLTGVVHSIIPDRIEAGTMIIAGAITRETFM